MISVGVVLMVIGVALFAVGFAWQADSRTRARINVATILFAYCGLVAALSGQLRT